LNKIASSFLRFFQFHQGKPPTMVGDYQSLTIPGEFLYFFRSRIKSGMTAESVSSL